MEEEILKFGYQNIFSPINDPFNIKGNSIYI